MLSLWRRAAWLAGAGLAGAGARGVAVSAALRVKEIQERKEGSSLVIEGVMVPSQRTALLVRAPTPPALTTHGMPTCYMCALGLEVKHTDVLIISQFVRSDGCMLPRRITGLCKMQQKKMSKMVAMAQKAGLMINLTPSYCKKDPKLRRHYKKYNTYFDETTIFAKKPPKWEDKFKR